MGRETDNPWKEKLLRQTGEVMRKELFWRRVMEDEKRGLHLAVMREPYLTMLMEGKKRVESRFGVVRQEPWGKVRRGDVLFLKRSSGAVVGVAEVGRVWGFEIGAEKSLGEIREEFEERVCAGTAFWEGCARARYATMMEIVRVGELGAIRCEKQDRRAWVVLRAGKGA